MNINWPHAKAAASASGNVLNMTEDKAGQTDFKALFASQLMQMWQDYRETGLTASEQMLKEAGGEEALQAKRELEEKGSALFKKDEDTAAEGKSSGREDCGPAAHETAAGRKAGSVAAHRHQEQRSGRIPDQAGAKEATVWRYSVKKECISSSETAYALFFLAQKPVALLSIMLTSSESSGISVSLRIA